MYTFSAVSLMALFFYGLVVVSVVVVVVLSLLVVSSSDGVFGVITVGACGTYTSIFAVNIWLLYITLYGYEPSWLVFTALKSRVILFFTSSVKVSTIYVDKFVSNALSFFKVMFLNVIVTLGSCFAVMVNYVWSTL